MFQMATAPVCLAMLANWQLQALHKAAPTTELGGARGTYEIQQDLTEYTFEAWALSFS